MNEKELDQLTKDVTEESQRELKQLQILRGELYKLHAELVIKENNFAAGYLSVDIDKLEDKISRYTKPLKVSKKNV